MGTNGKPDDPVSTSALKGFLEGVERKVTGEDSSLGVVWTAEAVREKPGVPDPPEGMARPLWDAASGVWRERQKMGGGIVLHAPEEDREIRDSSFPNRLGEAKIEAVEFTF